MVSESFKAIHYICCNLLSLFCFRKEEGLVMLVPWQVLSGK